MQKKKLLSISLLIGLLITTSTASAVVVSNVSELQNAVNNANSGGDKTILIANGVYDLSGIALQITANGVTIRGQSGNRSAVVLDSHYVVAGTSGIFRILASNANIADLTLKRPYYHAIHISPGGSSNVENVVIDNVHIIDAGEQAIKINPDSPDFASYTVNNGIIRNCLIELTDTGRAHLTSSYPCYTGGIDAHWAAGWTVQDNIIKGFWCSDGLSEHGIHFWNNSSNILVERNQVINCDRGIGFGLGRDRGNFGGIIRNNMIYHGPNTGFSDVGISLESTPNAQVYNNTIYYVHNYSAIEYRFETTTGVHIANNLTNRSVSQRDGATGLVQNNVANAQASWFVNTSAGDLHLASAVVSVVNQGLAISGLIDDFDGNARPYGSGYDIGADEYESGSSTLAPTLHLLLSEQVILEEKFESWPPTGWTIRNNGGDCIWQSNIGSNYAGGEGKCAAADSSWCGPYTEMDTELRTPVLDLSRAGSATLSYVSSYDDSSTRDDYAEVDISTNGGTTWTNLLRWSGSDHDRYGPGEKVTLNLTPYVGSNRTVIRFHYNAPWWCFWWMIDNVFVSIK